MHLNVLKFISLKYSKHTIDAFHVLLRAGLWGQIVHLSPYEPLDFDALFQLANGQSVVGLVAAGLEQVEDRKVSKMEALPFLKKVYSLEGRNASMNFFIETLVEKLRSAGVCTLLVKGQGVAQCYERPQWRSSGDIDFLLDLGNYEKAKSYLSELADSIEVEGVYYKHMGMTIGTWNVELHGTLHSGLSSRVDRVLDMIQNQMFTERDIRVWKNGETNVLLPGTNCDILFIFTHILQHFYKGGIGLRQVCDWCRLIWTYKNSIDRVLLESRICSMRLMSEWRAFAAFAVEYLGMPAEAMPLYMSGAKWKRKANRIQAFIMEVGNFGHNRDMNYYKKYPYLIRKTISFGQRLGDLCRHACIFPLDSFRFFPTIVYNGIKSAARGE